MKDLATTVPKNHLQKRSIKNISSEVVEEILSVTYPRYNQLFSFKKEELHGYIFNYLFNNDQDMFYKIGTFSNMMTASCLKGLQLIIQKNNLNSFKALDLHMATKKARSFISLGSTLAEHEVLDENEKANIIGGKRTGDQPEIPYSLYFLTNKGQTA